MATILQPKKSCALTLADGSSRVFKGGETFHKDSPRLEGLSAKQIAENFADWHPDNDVERATAAPGEKRTASPKKKSG